jgi:hypothetical protein
MRAGGCFSSMLSARKINRPLTAIGRFALYQPEIIYFISP